MSTISGKIFICSAKPDLDNVQEFDMGTGKKVYLLAYPDGLSREDAASVRAACKVGGHKVVEHTSKTPLRLGDVVVKKLDMICKNFGSEYALKRVEPAVVKKPPAPTPPADNAPKLKIVTKKRQSETVRMEPFVGTPVPKDRDRYNSAGFSIVRKPILAPPDHRLDTYTLTRVPRVSLVEAGVIKMGGGVPIVAVNNQV